MRRIVTGFARISSASTIEIAVMPLFREKQGGIRRTIKEPNALGQPKPTTIRREDHL